MAPNATYWRETAKEARALAKTLVQRNPRIMGVDRANQIIRTANLLNAADTLEGYANLITLFASNED